MKNKLQIITIIAALPLLVLSTSGQPLEGKVGEGSGPGWQSSWCDLQTPTSFKKGETLAIKVAGNAENVVVRLLPVLATPDSQSGIEGHSRKVPADNVLVVTLDRDHPEVKQISVHGGSAAWSTQLGVNNGTVTIVSIDRASK